MPLPVAEFLSQLPVLTGIDADAREFLAGLVREEHFEAGDVIVAEGQPGHRMAFVVAGTVKVVKSGDGDGAVVLAEMGPGEFFGEMSLVESLPRSASVVAETVVTVYTLSGVDFYRLYRHRPDQYGIVLLNLARDLARRLRKADEWFSHLSL